MAQDNRFDPARLEQIERRLQVLEDTEAIRNLKARYAALCDNHYDADGIVSLFTEDAVWESPALGRFEGRDAIRNFFRGASGIFSFAIHYSLNGHIEVDGADHFTILDALARPEGVLTRALLAMLGR